MGQKKKGNSMDDKELQLLNDIMEELKRDKTEARGTELELQYGFDKQPIEALLERYSKLHELTSAIEAETMDTPENRELIREYSPINTYFSTPQGKSRRHNYLEELRLLARQWQPIPKWVNAMIRVVNPFEECRSLSPVSGSIGKVIGQELKIFDNRYNIQAYPFIWVEFAFPVIIDRGIVVRREEYEALSVEEIRFMANNLGFKEVWSGREYESGLTCAYREEEIELCNEAI